jgi:hypothetical protein
MGDLVDEMIKMMLLNLNSSEYDLSSEQIAWIKKFIALSPKSLENILIDIKVIIEDKKIDLHDIPMIIKLITDVYYNDAIKINISKPKNIICFIKYTITILINSQYIDLSSAEKNVIMNIIDISLNLLTTNLKTNNIKCCFTNLGC